MKYRNKYRNKYQNKYTNKFGKRMLALLLATGMSLCGLTACGERESGTKVVFTTGFGKNEVFRIADESCSKAELMVYLTTTQNQYETVYGSEVWNISLEDVTLEENIKETVLAKIAQIKTMYLLALEKDIVLDEQEMEKVKLAATEYFQSLKDVEIEKMGVDQETVDNLYKEYALADKVYRHIIEGMNPEISDDEARTITVQHILIRTWTTDNAGEKIAFSDTAKQAAYEKACDIREMAVAGEQDFGELAAKYSEDSNINHSFGKGEMAAAYEAAAFMLETDEISQVIETEAGYHIIKCISTFNREETDANKLKIMEERKNQAFGQEYDQFVETLVRNLNQKVWNEIELIHDSEVTTSNFFEVYTKYFPSEE